MSDSKKARRSPSSKLPKPRVSREQWFRAALTALTDHGVESVKIEPLARTLGVAKSGFYWHFRDRADLLEAVLAYWEETYTTGIALQPELMSMPPAERLLRLAEAVIGQHLAAYDLPIRAWAQSDRRAARVVKRVNRLRLDYVGKAFAELGFEGDELEVRTRLFVCYASMEGALFTDMKRSDRLRLIGERVRVLTTR
jgi:AcrR family transcriptional regulator